MTLWYNKKHKGDFMDLELLLWIQEFIVHDFISPLMIFYTQLGEMGILWIIIIIGLLSNKKTRVLGILCAFSLITEFVINDLILKNIIARNRPFIDYPFDLLIKIPSSYSMPSGHSASSFAVAMVFVFRKEKRSVLMILLASLMAFSRLYLFVHYPSDVFIGILLGTFVAFAVVSIQRKYKFLKEYQFCQSLQD